MLNEVIGLSEEAVRRSRTENGSNDIKEEKRQSFFSKLIKNLSDPIIRILIIAFFVTLLFSGKGSGGLEAIGIGASILISTLISTLSEYGSEKAFRKMQREAGAQTCRVIRGAKEQSVGISDVVCGDYILIYAGDRIPADGVLISGSISCDMSAVNGESGEIYKSAADVNALMGAPADEHTLFRGASVTAGNGIMLVKAVGKDTYYGKIAGELQLEREESPLRCKLSKLAATLSKFGYFCAIAVALAHLVYTFGFDRSFVFSTRGVALELLHAFTLGISIVVVAVPEGLPMMITVVLSSNMIRMQKQNIRVRKPIGIETAGNVDILFTDKTGTLTYGNAKAVCYIMGDGVKAKRSVDMSPFCRTLLGVGIEQTSLSRIQRNQYEKKANIVMGNATDRALMSEYLDGQSLPRGVSRSAFLPFDSKIKLSAAAVELSGNAELRKKLGERITLVKGAPEILIKHCKEFYLPDGSRSRLNEEKIEKVLNAFSEKGGRMIAVITTTASSETVEKLNKSISSCSATDIEDLFENAGFLCLVGMRDELRREAKGAILSLKGAGIQTVMITGDSKKTATAIAKEASILGDGLDEIVLDSEELRMLDDDLLAKILPKLRVVARALPDDKSRLVRVARSCGRVTAMTGDGLNDAPALKAADVGFAMGSGTEVAKEAGDIIINSNDISTVRKAVLYGRTIFRSIKKFIVFQLIMNLSAVLVNIVGPFIGIENPVTVVQMLWINLIMDTLAAIAFAGESPQQRYMNEPPTRRDASVLDGDMITRIVVMGVVTVMICLYFRYSQSLNILFNGCGSDTFMSGFFALFVFCGIFCSLNARSASPNIFAGLAQNVIFVTVMAAVFCAQVGMIYFGGASLRCCPLSISQLKAIISLAMATVPSGILLELIMKKRVEE